MDEGLVKFDPAHQRTLMREWLERVVGLTLPEPADWSAWDADRRRWQP
jgi:hypothetical protein